MKLTKSKLKRIIQEEIQNVMSEQIGSLDPGVDINTFAQKMAPVLEQAGFSLCNPHALYKIVGGNPNVDPQEVVKLLNSIRRQLTNECSQEYGVANKLSGGTDIDF